MDASEVAQEQGDFVESTQDPEASMGPFQLPTQPSSPQQLSELPTQVFASVANDTSQIEITEAPQECATASNLCQENEGIPQSLVGADDSDPGLPKGAFFLEGAFAILQSPWSVIVTTRVLIAIDELLNSLTHHLAPLPSCFWLTLVVLPSSIMLLTGSMMHVDGSSLLTNTPHDRREWVGTLILKDGRQLRVQGCKWVIETKPNSLHPDPVRYGIVGSFVSLVGDNGPIKNSKKLPCQMDALRMVTNKKDGKAHGGANFDDFREVASSDSRFHFIRPAMPQEEQAMGEWVNGA